MEISADFVRPGRMLLAACICACIVASCRVSSNADSANDAKKWQGTWKLVHATYDGEPQSADMAWIVDGDQYIIRLNGVLHEDPNRFTLDASAGRIDVIHHETPPGTYGGKVKGIYAISGDSLTVCYDLTGQRYPESFDAKQGSRQVLLPISPRVTACLSTPRRNRQDQTCRQAAPPRLFFLQQGKGIGMVPDRVSRIKFCNSS
jgi:uncharacterized protein (TIGR03067 family)